MHDPKELTVEECLDRLAAETVGRLAFAAADGPRIVPLNYALVDDAIVVRTTAYSEVATHAVGHPAAFEVDRLDHDTRTGWSVLVVGVLHDLEPADLENVHKVWTASSWAGGVRNRYLQLRWREVSGRRLGDSPSAPARRVL